VIVVFVGLYVAADPDVYARGLVRLVPMPRRRRAREVLEALARTLRRWLVGKLLGMAVIAVATWAGLSLAGVPLALVLGLLAGLLNFVPYLGPMLSFVPALPLAIPEGATTVGWVLGLYVGIQMAESYLLTPLVDQQSVALPPALTITAQVLLGVLLGWLGLVLATPLTAAALVLVRMLYVEDLLGDSEDSSAPAEEALSRPLRRLRG
jgi:predicted PurR-regulated permease PerM